MSNLKEEILKDTEEHIKKSIPRLDKFEIASILNFLSSKIDEIEKEVMGLLPEENIKPPRTFTEKGYNSAIQTIREKITKYFL